MPIMSITFRMNMTVETDITTRGMALGLRILFERSSLAISEIVSRPLNIDRYDFDHQCIKENFLSDYWRNT